MSDSKKLLVLRAFGAEKRAVGMLGLGPTDSAGASSKDDESDKVADPSEKSTSMTKTGPQQGPKALGGLMNFMRTKAQGDMSPQASVNVQDAKKPEDEEEETEPGVEKLESASDTPAKKAPAKKPEEPSENEVEYAETEKKSALGTALGMGIGGVGGGLLGGMAGKRLFPQQGAEDTASSKKQLLSAVVGMLLGTAGGGALGHHLSKSAPQPEPRRRFRKLSADYGEQQGMSRTSKLLLGALAGAGIPVALWHGSGPMVRKLITKIYKAAPLEKLYNMPKAHPKITKALMYAPAAAGAAIGGLSKDEEPEFKLSNFGMSLVKLSEGGMPMGNVGTMTADQPSKDLIPYLGPLGGKVLSGLGGITGGLGMPGVSEKLKGWSENPTARSIAGGGTTAIAALLTALAARRLMRGRQDEVEE